MAGVIGHAREPLDHHRDPRQGPEVRRKPMRAGTLAECVLDTRQLGPGQFRFPPCPPGPAQRGASTSSPDLIPAAHALPAHPQGAGDLGHDLARRKQARRTPAAPFQGVEVSAWGYRSVHAPILHEGAANVTLFYEIH